ncbi:MAG: hypothetical protein HY054_06335 [Proteobacteria bacterium]|nr:hypothetical protein [Pseudomonadota bacterium]
MIKGLILGSTLVLSACDLPGVPTATGQHFYEQLQLLLPARFASAPLLVDWRGFDYGLRQVSATVQCGVRVYDLPRDQVREFVDDVEAGRSPEAMVDSYGGQWMHIGAARTSGTGNGENAQVIDARGELPLRSDENFCLMPIAEYRQFAARATALWSRDDTVFKTLHWRLGGGPSGDPIVTADYYALLDADQNRLYVWFFSASPLG